MNNRPILCLLPAAVVLSLAACSSAPSKPSPAPVTPTPPAVKESGSNATAQATPVVPAYLDPHSPIYQQRSVYFDFDASTIKPAYTSVIEAHGHYLAQNQSLHVRVEGNTDERGSSEYNLALGQRRAEAVKSALQVYGAQSSQIEAVSFGEEHAKASGHDETAWAQNRRADIAYPQR